MKDKKFEDLIAPGFSLLGREKLLTRIKEEILSSNQNSFRLAVHGIWGSGKTIFMKQLIYELEIEDNINTVYLDACQSDYFDNPLLSLLVKLKELPNFRKDLEINLSKKQIKDIDGFIGLGGVGVNFSVRANGKEVIDQIEQRTYLIEILNETIHNFIQESSKKVVLVIDELDRCKPDFTIKLMEIIRYIDCDNFYVLFSIDYKQLCAVINKYYGSEYNSEDYLWKVFDEIINLTSLSNEVMIEYILNNLKYPIGKFISNEIFADSITHLNLSLRNLNRFVSIVERCKVKRFGFISDHEEIINSTTFFILLLIKSKQPLMFRESVVNNKQFLAEIMSKLPLYTKRIQLVKKVIS